MKRVFLSTMLVFGIVLIMAIVSAADFYVIPVKKRHYAPVPKTGQTTSYATGDDGDLEKGVAWPIPRFTINADNTVTDNFTKLIWLRNANCIQSEYPEFDNDGGTGDGLVTWQHALDFVAGINNGTYPNCGGGHTDWRLPNINEIRSLIHFEFYLPSLPNTSGTGQWQQGDPFTDVQFSEYWTSTAFVGGTNQYVLFESVTVPGNGGRCAVEMETCTYLVWPVRGGR